MLKISKDSWHYRWAYNSWGAQINRKGDITSMHPVENPGNLCCYIRQLIKPIPTLVIVGFILACFLSVPVCWLLGIPVLPDLPEGYIVGGWEALLRLLHIFGLVIWALIGLIVALCAIGFGGAFVHEEVYTPWKQNREAMIANGEIPEPQPGIIRQYLTALHEKTCPLLEIEQDDNEEPGEHPGHG